jgi:hypothetical protein
MPLKLRLSTLLKRLGACYDAVEWSKPYGTDYQKAWNECPNAPWLLWIIAMRVGKCKPESTERRKLSLAAVECAARRDAATAAATTAAYCCCCLLLMLLLLLAAAAARESINQKQLEIIRGLYPVPPS